MVFSFNLSEMFQFQKMLHSFAFLYQVFPISETKQNNFHWKPYCEWCLKIKFTHLWAKRVSYAPSIIFAELHAFFKRKILITVFANEMRTTGIF
jgi:hypothetical protein